jgi:hypothetical protein
MKAMIVMGLLGFSNPVFSAQNDCDLPVAVEALPGLVDFLGNEAIDWADEGPISIDTENLPPGAIDGEALVQIVEGWREESPSLLDVFQRISDGQKRTISGDAVRDAIRLAGLVLPNFIPADALVDVVIENGQIRVRLDSDQAIDVPLVRTWVLDPEDPSDPYAVGRRNRPYRHASDSYVLKISKDLLFDLDENGLHGIRDGDLKGAKFIFSKNIAIKSVHGEPGVQRLDGAVVLETDAKGEPLIENGYYVPKSADEWIEVTAGSNVSRVPVPRMGMP